MKHIIFRIIAFIVGLLTAPLFIYEGLQGNISLLGMVVYMFVAVTFLLYGIGGEKLLAKIPIMRPVTDSLPEFFTNKADQRRKENNK